MQNPSVSVIVPALDARATIVASLHSALSDKSLSVEVLVIDDGSLDGTSQAVSELGDSRIRQLSTGQRRSGPSNARNTGLAAARGEWIAVLDADDVFVQGRLAVLLQATSATHADLVADDIWIQPADRDTATTTLFHERRFPIDGMQTLRAVDLARFDLGLLQPLVRRSLLKEHRITYRAHGRASEDFAFLYDCVRAAKRPIVVPKAGYVYVKQPNSVSSSTTSFWLDSISVTAELLRDHDPRDPTERKELERRMRHAERRYHYLLARREEKSGSRARSIARLIRHPSASALATRAAVRRIPDRRSSIDASQ